MKILGKTIHGSRLYGLHSESSDHDFKGLFLNSVESCLLMTAAKNENYKIKENNEEFENFSLPHFLKLAANSEDVCLSMLHAPDSAVIIDSEIYKYLRDNRKKFHTKRMVGSLKFAKGMACKYSLRADRALAVETIVKILSDARDKGVVRIHQIWDELPEGQYFAKGIESRNNTADKRFFECAGKKVVAMTSIDYALDIYQNLYNAYGDRVKMAASLDGNDLKAISHSFRIGYSLLSLFRHGDFTFPLAETQFIKDVKYGKLRYIEDNLDAKLNELITEIESLSEKSNYPDKVDNFWLERIVLDAYNHTYLGDYNFKV